jgi:hypothetical protein
MLFSFQQRSYRGYRERRGLNRNKLSASQRWTDAISEARWRNLTVPESRQSRELKRSSLEKSDNDEAAGPKAPQQSRSGPRENWHRLTNITKHAFVEDSSDEEDEEFEGTEAEKDSRRASRVDEKKRREQKAKTMSLRYFLEMVDVKHRYGSNLRAYHQEWQKSKTKESFFYWLDHGEGKHVDLKMAPRARLDAEQVRYLSREERQHYLVNIDSEGRLCWTKNGARIDTTTEFKDSMNGKNLTSSLC